MSTIVVTTFELGDGVESDAFVEADSRYQQDVAYQQPGLGRRTTSVGQGTPASWCIIEWWVDEDHAVAWHTSDLGSLVTNVERRSYETLD